MRFRLRTLLIVMAALPPALAGWWLAALDPESATLAIVLGAIPGLLIFALIATAIRLTRERHES